MTTGYAEIVAILMAMAARWPVNMGSKLHLPLPVKLAPSLPPLLLKHRDRRIQTIHLLVRSSVG